MELSGFGIFIAIVFLIVLGGAIGYGFANHRAKMKNDETTLPSGKKVKKKG